MIVHPSQLSKRCWREKYFPKSTKSIFRFDEIVKVACGFVVSEVFWFHPSISFMFTI